MSVQVAVRVRPFNERELKANAKLCIEMVPLLISQSGATTVIKDFETGKPRNFTFNFSFWSHDEFITDENGVYVPTGDKYADQQQVYNAVSELLKGSWGKWSWIMHGKDIIVVYLHMDRQEVGRPIQW